MRRCDQRLSCSRPGGVATRWRAWRRRWRGAEHSASVAASVGWLSSSNERRGLSGLSRYRRASGVVPRVRSPRARAAATFALPALRHCDQRLPCGRHGGVVAGHRQRAAGLGRSSLLFSWSEVTVGRRHSRAGALFTEPDAVTLDHSARRSSDTARGRVWPKILIT